MHITYPYKDYIIIKMRYGMYLNYPQSKRCVNKQPRQSTHTHTHTLPPVTRELQSALINVNRLKHTQRCKGHDVLVIQCGETQNDALLH